MKIVYLHQYFNTPDMSGGTRSYEMAKRMVDAGHEVHVVTSQREIADTREIADKKGKWFQSSEAGITVHWFPVPYSNYMNYKERIKAFFIFAQAARKRSIELNGDVVFASSTPLTIALPAVFTSRKCKIPMVFEVRDLWPEMPIAMGALHNPILRYTAFKLEKWAYQNADAVVALSPGMKEGVMRAGYNKKSIAVIPNGSDNVEFKYNANAENEFRRSREWLGEQPLLVYTGTFGKVNDVGYMVDLAKELLRINSDIKILMVGSGSEYDKVFEMAVREKVCNVNLFFENPVPKRMMPVLLSAANMASNLVADLPEARANSANKFFDTLAAGKPIFLNHGGWMHDLVKAHQCGLAMWGVPIETVAVELNSKMHNREWLDQAGESARHLAEVHFDRDTLAGQLISVLEAAVSKNTSICESIAPGIYND